MKFCHNGWPAWALLLYIWLCLSPITAGSHLRKAHEGRESQTQLSSHGENSTEGTEDEDDDDDDDDDDNDDDEDSAAAAPKSPSHSSFRAIANKAAQLDDLEKRINPHAHEEAKMKADIEKSKQELKANLLRQKELLTRLSHLTDKNASDVEIDTAAARVAIETESTSMAHMLGKMWKEMRMFEIPFYAKHVDVELRGLRREEQALEKKIEADQGKLSQAQKRWAKEGKGEAKSKDVEEDEESKTKEKEPKAKEPKAKEKEVKGAKEEEKAAPKAAALSDDEPAPTPKTEKITPENGLANYNVQYNFWAMPWKQQEKVMMHSLAYLLFGILFAFLYWHANGKNPKTFTPVYTDGVTHSGVRFAHSLFSCFGDIKVCLLGCCCPCLRWAHTLERKNLMGSNTYYKGFFLMYILMLLHPYTAGFSYFGIIIIGVFYRQKLRTSYGIKKSFFQDLAVWTCCQPCAMQGILWPRAQCEHLGRPALSLLVATTGG
jgi:Cys-rich protein (TIGR01571 family)